MLTEISSSFSSGLSAMHRAAGAPYACVTSELERHQYSMCKQRLATTQRIWSQHRIRWGDMCWESCLVRGINLCSRKYRGGCDVGRKWGKGPLKGECHEQGWWGSGDQNGALWTLRIHWCGTVAKSLALALNTPTLLGEFLKLAPPVLTVAKWGRERGRTLVLHQRTVMGVTQTKTHSVLIASAM